MRIAMNFGIVSVIASVLLMNGWFAPSFADVRKSTGKLSTAQLLTLIRESESVKSKSELNLLGTGPGVTVLTTPYEGAGRRDLQIEAIFVARALIEGAPGQVENVKVIFAGRPSRGVSSEEGVVANIDKAMILDYGSGRVSAEKLLAAVRLTSVQPETTPNVVPGPQQERRLLIWQRIDKLAQQGTGVKPFKALFDSAEEVAGSGDRSALSTKLEDLEIKLSEQEEQVALARKVAQGKGVIGSVKSSNSLPQTGSSLLKPPNAQSQLSKSSRLGSGGPAGGSSPADRNGGGNLSLRRLYANRQLLLSTLSRKGDPNLSRVQDLFSGAEEKLNSGKETEALRQLGDIKSILERSDSGIGRPFSRGPYFERARKDRLSI